ncbi:hypothetical protein Poly24_04990 [Rosistilla carotiformis]|uniref:Uncharacterized protein n=1 Tax=Rosistilla carotiformis TaxID=2528017 RepID=A0A518JMU0_9BACT|nr:hypothetical protein Poly24_04990 [Rosistilla carotiformis]
MLTKLSERFAKRMKVVPNAKIDKLGNVRKQSAALAGL